MATQALTAYATARKYVAELVAKGMAQAEQDERLLILGEFCRFVGRTPDEMIAEIFNVETQKYRKRNFYSERVTEFSAQISGTWSEVTRQVSGNVSGRVGGGTIQAAVSGAGFTAGLSISTSGNRQSVTIQPSGGDIRAVSVNLMRSR